MFSGQRDLLKSPRGAFGHIPDLTAILDSSKSIGSPKSARQRFAETPSSVRTPIPDGDLYEGVLLVDDIFESKGILVDVRFSSEAVELTTPSIRLVCFVRSA